MLAPPAGVMSPPLGMAGPPAGLGMAMAAAAASAVTTPQYHNMASVRSLSPQPYSRMPPATPGIGSPQPPPPGWAAASEHHLDFHGHSVGHPLLGRPVPEPPAALRAFGAVPQPAPMPVVPHPPPPPQVTAEADWLVLKQEVEHILKESTALSAHMHVCHLCGSPFDGDPLKDNREGANRRMGQAVEVVWGRASQFAQDLGCWSAEIRRSEAEAASLMDFLQEMRIQYVEQVENRVRTMRAENEIQIRRMEDEIRVRRAALPVEMRPGAPRKEDISQPSSSSTAWPPALSPMLGSAPPQVPGISDAISAPPLAALARVPLPADQAAQLVSPLLPGMPKPVYPLDAATSWANSVPQPSAMPRPLSPLAADQVLKSLSSSVQTLPPHQPLSSSATLPPDEGNMWAPVVQRRSPSNSPSRALASQLEVSATSGGSASWPSAMPLVPDEPLESTGQLFFVAGEPVTLPPSRTWSAQSGTEPALAEDEPAAQDVNRSSLQAGPVEADDAAPEVAQPVVSLASPETSPQLATRPVVSPESDYRSIGSSVPSLNLRSRANSAGRTAGRDQWQAPQARSRATTSATASRAAAKSTASQARRPSQTLPAKAAAKQVATKQAAAPAGASLLRRTRPAVSAPSAPSMPAATPAASSNAGPSDLSAPDPIFSRVRSALQKVNERNAAQAAMQPSASIGVYNPSDMVQPSGFAFASPSMMASPAANVTAAPVTLPPPASPLSQAFQAAPTSAEAVHAEALQIFGATSQFVAEQAAESKQAEEAASAYPVSPLEGRGFSTEQLDRMIASAEAPSAAPIAQIVSEGRGRVSAPKAAPAQQRSSASRSPDRRAATAGGGARRTAPPQPSASSTDARFTATDVKKFLQGNKSSSLRPQKWGQGR